MVNALADEAGTVRQRPGIATWSGFPSTIPNASPVVGMVPFGEFLVYVTEDRKLFAVQGGAVADLSDSTAATKLDGASRPSLIATRNKVVAVGGGLPQKWTSGLSARLGGSPPMATHIAGIATRLVVSQANPSGQLQWSGLGDSGHETWDALDYAEAEADPDVIRALHGNTNELFVFGAKTLQKFVPDAVVGFAPVSTVGLGLLAPYSVVPLDDQFAFLDRSRRIMLTDGRGYQETNPQLGKTFDAIGTVSDCWGFHALLDQWDLGVWMFPTHGKGYIWDRGANRWSEWRAWNGSAYSEPTITSAVSWPEKNLTLVGLSTGQIARLDGSTYSDLGEVLKVEITTGFTDRGTSQGKACKAARFRFKRGQTSQGSTAPVVVISYRDDLGAFRVQRRASLGVAGDYNPVIDLRSLGTYRQRQWKIEFTAASELSFVGAEEEFEVLSN